MSNASWEPQHFSIVTLDIEGFGSPTRTDPIRAGLRSTLKLITDSASGSLREPNPVHASGDTGDGSWLIFASRVPKSRIISAFLPTLETELRHHNLTASTAALLRLRVGVHHGELIKDGGGYSGEALNHTFRIIDNGVVRQALLASPAHLVAAISNDFFEKVIKPGYGSLDAEAFAPVHVQTKETATIVWVSSNAANPNTSANLSMSQAMLNVDRTNQRVLTIGDLPPTSLYLPVTDVHNARLYGRTFPGAPIRQHIEAGLLLSEKIVLHCADAYRSREVADALDDFTSCVEAGDILFLLGENAQVPGVHFRSYIDYKVEQYSKSSYGKRDVASLTEVDDDAADRAENLLRMSPFALIRGFSGTDGFIRAAKMDMQPGESIAIREHFVSSLVGRLSLTIRQLLDLTQLGHDGSLTRVVADDSTVGLLQGEVERLASHNSFSRQTFLEAIRRRTGLAAADPLDPIFEERVSLVHLMGTLGGLTHMEITNRRDRMSLYYYGNLVDHLSILAEVPHPATFGTRLVLELRALPNWWAFVAHHLRLAGDAAHRVAFGEVPIDLSAAYRWSRRIPEFESIRSVVRHHWG